MPPPSVLVCTPCVTGSTGNPLSFEPALGVFNDSALDAADYAIHVAESVGIKLIVPLTGAAPTRPMQCA